MFGLVPSLTGTGRLRIVLSEFDGRSAVAGGMPRVAAAGMPRVAAAGMPSVAAAGITCAAAGGAPSGCPTAAGLKGPVLRLVKPLTTSTAPTAPIASA